MRLIVVAFAWIGGPVGQPRRSRLGAAGSAGEGGRPRQRSRRRFAGSFGPRRCATRTRGSRPHRSPSCRWPPPRLDAWPADKVFRTRLMSEAPVREGVLEGDLVLQGDGDPSLDDHSLWSLAAQLKGTGITSIRGQTDREWRAVRRDEVRDLRSLQGAGTERYRLQRAALVGRRGLRQLVREHSTDLARAAAPTFRDAAFALCRFPSRARSGRWAKAVARHSGWSASRARAAIVCASAATFRWIAARSCTARCRIPRTVSVC